MRAVLDTNVIVSALLWGGTPFKLLQAATDGDLELYTSPVLLEELHDVLSRKHLANKLAEQQNSVERAITLYGELAIIVTPLATPASVPTDSDDDHVIAVAPATGADLIVTGDSDLLVLHPYQEIQILNAANAFQHISSTV